MEVEKSSCGQNIRRWWNIERGKIRIRRAKVKYWVGRKTSLRKRRSHSKVHASRKSQIRLVY